MGADLRRGIGQGGSLLLARQAAGSGAAQRSQSSSPSPSCSPSWMLHAGQVRQDALSRAQAAATGMTAPQGLGLGLKSPATRGDQFIGLPPHSSSSQDKQSGCLIRPPDRHGPDLDGDPDVGPISAAMGVGHRRRPRWQITKIEDVCGRTSRSASWAAPNPGGNNRRVPPLPLSTSKSHERSSEAALHKVKMHLHRRQNPGPAWLFQTKCTAGRRAAGFVRHVTIDVSQTQLSGNFRGAVVRRAGLRHGRSRQAARSASTPSPLRPPGRRSGQDPGHNGQR